MRLSILIPTCDRPDAMRRCLEGLAPECISPDIEILVGLDGPASLTPDPVIPASIEGKVRPVRLPRSGIIRVRRALLREARGEYVLWLNDDVVAAPGLIADHLAVLEHGGARVVGGAARWRPVPEPDLFDRLVQSTDLVFFRPVRPEATKPYVTDYRSCYGLNMSFPRALAERAGGVPDLPESYGYDDTELVYRLAAAGAEVWHAPAAAVVHDHRYRPADVHRREYLLGRAAWHYGHANPAFARDLFRRDIQAEAELAYCREVLRRERRDAERIERSFLDLATRGAEDASDGVLHLLAEHWVLLKRYLWRWGLLDASANRPVTWSLLREVKSAPGEDAVVVAQ
ncbi:MAG: glycosyltransferase family 2 protein [Phycisphaerales bacterium]|nr:glycosyltransferase family 2 protein [Phycisphaerales bacterium]